MTEQTRETLARLEEFKEQLIEGVCALQMLPPEARTDAVTARVWAFLKDTANSMREEKIGRMYTGIEEHCFTAISAFDPAAGVIPTDPPADIEPAEVKKKKKG